MKVARRFTRRRVLGATLGMGAAWLSAGACGGEPETPRGSQSRIGMLHTDEFSAEQIDAFRQRLRDLGHRDGDLTLEVRAMKGDFRAGNVQAAELAALKPHVIVAHGAPASDNAQRLNPGTPIVALLPLVGDAVSRGLARSPASPGGNVTGLLGSSEGLWGKRLELLKDAVPGLARVAVLWKSIPMPPFETWEGYKAAKPLAIEMLRFEVASEAGLDAAFRAAVAEGAQAFAWFATGVISVDHVRVAGLALAHGLPSISDLAEYTSAGGLMTYAGDRSDWMPRAAVMADKILRGQRPGDIPLEGPGRYLLSVNLKTAASLGITLPRSLLAQAVEVVN